MSCKTCNRPKAECEACRAKRLAARAERLAARQPGAVKPMASGPKKRPENS